MLSLSNQISTYGALLFTQKNILKVTKNKAIKEICGQFFDASRPRDHLKKKHKNRYAHG